MRTTQRRLLVALTALTLIIGCGSGIPDAEQIKADFVGRQEPVFIQGVGHRYITFRDLSVIERLTIQGKEQQANMVQYEIEMVIDVGRRYQTDMSVTYRREENEWRIASIGGTEGSKPILTPSR